MPLDKKKIPGGRMFGLLLAAPCTRGVQLSQNNLKKNRTVLMFYFPYNRSDGNIHCCFWIKTFSYGTLRFGILVLDEDPAAGPTLTMSSKCIAFFKKEMHKKCTLPIKMPANMPVLCA
jgi:hypothetical protein